MTDSCSKKPITVVIDDAPWPYIEVQYDQLDFVKKLLDGAGYRYSVDKYAMSINDEPFNLTIAFEPRIDVSVLQKLFDDNEAPKLSRPKESTYWPSRMRSGHWQRTLKTIWMIYSTSAHTLM